MGGNWSSWAKFENIFSILQFHILDAIELLLFLNLNTNVMLESPTQAKSYLIFSVILISQQKIW